MTQSMKPAREGKPKSHTPDDVRLLAVALNRALQRRLGDVPSPTDVNKAVNKLAHDGAKPSAFVQHAIRVQEQLARLHEQLQVAQKGQDHAIVSIQDPPAMSPSRPRKRSAENDDDSTYPAQETKRMRLDSPGPPQPPHTHPPPSTSDDQASPESKAPAGSMSPGGTPIASQNIRGFAEPPRADSVRLRRASVDDLPSGLPIVATVPPTPSNHTTSDSNLITGHRSPSNGTGETKSQMTRPGGPAPVDPPSAQTHAQDKLGKVPSLSISTAIPEVQGSFLPTVASPTTIPASTRQQTASSALTSPFVANVPGIWAIQVGKPSAGQTDIAFVVDQDTASSVHRWATHRRGFDPAARHVVVHLVALQTAAVSAAQHNLSQSPGGMRPQAFALALQDLRPQWPDDGSLVLQLNAGQPGERTWFLSDISDGVPLDVSGAICEGTNSLRIMQLKNMADIVFAMYAAPPTPETLAAALEWERFRTLYSFQRPPSGWSLR